MDVKGFQHQFDIHLQICYYGRMDRFTVQFDDVDAARLIALAERLGSEKRRPAGGRRGKMAVTATVRDLMAIVELVERDYPGIVRQAIPAPADNGSGK